MAEVNPKTVRLAEGNHGSPEEGACVVELASMLADEPFGDKPNAVSPVIREFLRDYNDDLNYARRQDLHALAAEVVGTSVGREVEGRRARMCLRWAGEACGRSPGGVPRWWVRLSMMAGRHKVAGAYAARAATCMDSADTHRAAMTFVTELCAVGREDAPPPVEATPPLPVEAPATSPDERSLSRSG